MPDGVYQHHGVRQCPTSGVLGRELSAEPPATSVHNAVGAGSGVGAVRRRCTARERGDGRRRKDRQHQPNGDTSVRTIS